MFCGRLGGVFVRLRVVGAESLGVRGLSCFVDLDGFSVLVDPGVALGFSRFGLHPHPLQAVFSELCKVRLASCWLRASCVVITHLHGDHVPLFDANPFQFSLDVAGMLHRGAPLWVKAADERVPYEKARFDSLCERFRGGVVAVDGGCSGFDGLLEFSGLYPHGLNEGVRVAAVRVGVEGDCVVHLSDTQLLVDEAVEWACLQRPRVVVADGVPFYRLRGSLRMRAAGRAWVNACRLAGCADCVVVDHHVCRSLEGFRWLDSLSGEVGGRVVCAADYMGFPRLALEAWRRVLYEVMPVPRDWFVLWGYRGFGECVGVLGEVAAEFVRRLPRGVVLSEVEVGELLGEVLDSVGWCPR